jgi:hypothetical protein
MINLHQLNVNADLMKEGRVQLSIAVFICAEKSKTEAPWEIIQRLHVRLVEKIMRPSIRENKKFRLLAQGFTTPFSEARVILWEMRCTQTYLSFVGM